MATKPGPAQGQQSSDQDSETEAQEQATEATAPAGEGSGKVANQCDNCEKDAAYESDGVSASPVRLCDDHKPDNAK